MIVHAEPVMGTVVSFHIADGEGADRALGDAVAWLHEVDGRFSPFRPDSEVTRLADGRFDPSGLVKGWAVERAAKGLTTSAIQSLAIDAGGDVVVRSGPKRREPWRIGIRHPDRPDCVAAVLAIRDGAVATSGAYERGSHIRDPRDGHVPSEVRSMTVVGPDLTWADTFATAAYVMGRDGLAWVAGHPGYDALAITWDDAMTWTAGMDRHLLR